MHMCVRCISLYWKITCEASIIMHYTRLILVFLCTLVECSCATFVPVPDYLRTKLDLDLEAKQRELYQEALSNPVKPEVSLLCAMWHLVLQYA